MAFPAAKIAVAICLTGLPQMSVAEENRRVVAEIIYRAEPPQKSDNELRRECIKKQKAEIALLEKLGEKDLNLEYLRAHLGIVTLELEFLRRDLFRWNHRHSIPDARMPKGTTEAEAVAKLRREYQRVEIEFNKALSTMKTLVSGKRPLNLEELKVLKKSQAVFDPYLPKAI